MRPTDSVLGVAGLLLLAAAQGLAASADPAKSCPVMKIAFAPPLGQPMQLTRTIVRPVAQGEFRQTVTYRVLIERAGRGYRMRWQQTGQQASGPPELLRLLTLEADSAEGESLDFTLDANGALLGVAEAPDAAQRLARSLDRLRSDPALTSRPARERAIIGQMLDRMAALQPAERADLLLARVAQLVAVAGRDCSAGAFMAADGTQYRITAMLDMAGHIALASISSVRRDDGSEMQLLGEMVVSADTGLAATIRRETRISAGGVTRTSHETLELKPTGE